MNDGHLAETFKVAMELAAKMRADGASRADCDEAVATALREAWPKDRDEPWRYYCDRCIDTGWVVKACQQGLCGRPFKLPKQASDDHTGQGTCRDGHTYAEPCWCQKGQALKSGLLKTPRLEDDAIEVAARTSKPTRVGR